MYLERGYPIPQVPLDNERDDNCGIKRIETSTLNPLDVLHTRVARYDLRNAPSWYERLPVVTYSR